MGYVGLPLALAFAKEGMQVTGFDINKKRIWELGKGIDCTNENNSEELHGTGINFSCNEKDIAQADFVIVCVPTPIKKNKKPDLLPVESASRTVGKNLKEGAIVVFESTVWPGLTEEACVPLIEKFSGKKCGNGFFIGYSPERINPGDRQHSVTNVVKVVAGMDEKTTEKIACLYGKVCKAGIFKAKNIRTAEAAKVIENIQRDLNIALMNELSMLFNKMGIETKDVLEAAYTKWNFGRYKPGLVGGHCIPVDPYYLVQKAKSEGFNTKVILAGRSVNDSMHMFAVELAKSGLKKIGKEIFGAKVLLLGLTFKENVKDTRETQAKKIIHALKEEGADVFACDPLLDSNTIEKEFRVKPVPIEKIIDGFDCFIVVTAHEQFKKISISDLAKQSGGKAALIDTRNLFEKEEAEKSGLAYYGF